MFKKREKNQNSLKRTNEDRYQDESNQDELNNVKRLKTNHNHDHCKHTLQTSTKEHQHYRQDYIRQEVNDLSSFKSDLIQTKPSIDAATKHLEIDTPQEHDAIALARQNIEISKGIKEGRLDPKVYRGMHGYQNYFEQSEEDLRRKQFTGTLGPVRAPTFIRNTTRVDYNPERCKDWYETGRCNFGDSCVFIHDRSDYKSGWQLDQEFEAEMKRKQMKMMGHEVDDDEENYEIHSQEENPDEIPLVCRICESIFSNPVVTTCGHYFCERCALQHYSESSNCHQCGKPTNGIFNEAPKVTQKLQELNKKQKEVEDEQNSGENNEDEDNVSPTEADTKLKQNNISSESDEDGGVLSKKDREVFKEYKERNKEVAKKKYQSQTGWFIP